MYSQSKRLSWLRQNRKHRRQTGWQTRASIDVAEVAAPVLSSVADRSVPSRGSSKDAKNTDERAACAHESMLTSAISLAITSRYSFRLPSVVMCSRNSFRSSISSTTASVSINADECETPRPALVTYVHRTDRVRERAAKVNDRSWRTAPSTDRHRRP